MTKLLSTIAKRKRMAALVSRVASEALGIQVALTASDLYPGELHFRAENLESERGPVHHLALDVCPRGVNVHIKFGFPDAAPVGANTFSGKWNHYIWPESDDTPESYAEWVEEHLFYLLAKVELRPGVARASRPCAWEAWVPADL
jgi:hypothetical protein